MSSHDSTSTTPQGDITDKIYKTWSCVSAFFRSSRHIMNLATNAISRSRGKKPGNTPRTMSIFLKFACPFQTRAEERARGGEQTGGSSGGRQCARVRRDIQLHGLLLSWGAEASHPCVTTSSRRQGALPSFRRVVCVRQPVTAKGSHDSGVCQRDGQQPSRFDARNIRLVISAASTTYVSLTGARSSANLAGRAVRKRPAAEIWPPEPKCVG